MLTALPFEWFVLLLRIIFIFLLYFFIFQVVRVVLREMSFVATPSDDLSDDVPGHLVVVSAGNSGLRRGSLLELEPVTVIGRHPRATVRLDDSFVSNQHAQVSWNEGRWWLTDLDSTNGTLLNGRPVTSPTGLRYGDVIAIGDVQLQFAP
jgi:hypothetical protein